MNGVMMKALTFIAIIILGYLLKSLGIAKEKHYKLVSKLVLRCTLPAAIINGFVTFRPDPQFFYVLLLGLGGNLLMIALGFLLQRGATREGKIFYVLNLAGFNIGCFGLPFAQTVLGPTGVVATCMFDLGNSLMCTGGTYALLKEVLPLHKQEKTGISWLGILKNLLSSVPFDTYTLMLVLIAFNLKLPKPLLDLAGFIAQYNGFVSMFMLGLMLQLTLDKAKLQMIKKVLLIRHLLCLFFALGAYYLLPFSLEIRQVLAITFLAPITVLAAVFADKLEANVELSGLAASLSILFSLVLLTGLLPYLIG